MRFGRRGHGSRFLVVEMTPMIDVVFLLIIFFMTTAQFARLTRADVDLPHQRGEQLETPEEEGIVINITTDGQLVISTDTVTIDELESLIRGEISRSRSRNVDRVKVMIRADRGGDTRVLNEVIRRLQAMGVPGAQLATEVP